MEPYLGGRGSHGLERPSREPFQHLRQHLLGGDASLQEAACALRKEGVSHGGGTDHAVRGEEGDTARG